MEKTLFFDDFSLKNALIATNTRIYLDFETIPRDFKVTIWPHLRHL